MYICTDFLSILGSGSFGEVYDGELNDGSSAISKKVAVKTLKNNDASMEFFKEALTVSKLKHENIVQFYGIILDIEDCLIMEFMGGGELLDYLKSNGRSLTFDDQIKMCFDIVKGCTYLEEKKFVHRDLAARNCLLSSNDPTERMVIYFIF